MIRIIRIYFGSHGNLIYGASIQIELAKAYFKHLTSNVPDFPDEEFDGDE